MTGHIQYEWSGRSRASLRLKVGAIVVFAIAHQPGSDLIGLEAAAHERVLLGDRPRLFQACGAQHDEAACPFRNWPGKDELSRAIELRPNRASYHVDRARAREGLHRDQDELDDYPLLTLLEGVNETMTGIGLKYVTMAHLI